MREAASPICTSRLHHEFRVNPTRYASVSVSLASVMTAISSPSLLIPQRLRDLVYDIATLQYIND